MSDVFEFEFTGKMPLIMHWNNIEGRDELEEWRQTPEGKKLSKPGDDRTPPWSWHYYLYHDGQHVVMPTDNIMSALLFGGQKTTIIGAKKGSYKELSQSGLLVLDESYPILVGGKPIAMKEVAKLRDLKFSEQKARAAKLGIELYVKPVTIGKSSHIRVRPRFDEWSIRGKIEIIDPLISFEGLKLIMENTGRRAGLGDRRPGVVYPKIPGPYGTFDARIKRA